MAARLLTAVLLCALSSAAIDHPLTKAERERERKNRIPADSKIYVDTNNGFEMFILAAFEAKRVPLQIVGIRENADYVLDSSLFHDSQFLATAKGAGTYHFSEAAFKLTSKAGDIVWAYAATKGLFSRGGSKQSVAEACAKHLKDHVQPLKKGAVIGAKLLEAQQQSSAAGQLSPAVTAPVPIPAPTARGSGDSRITSSPIANEPPPGPVPSNGPAPQRIRVGDDVQHAKLIRQTHPIYPPLARKTGISGVVRLNAIVGSDGAVQNLTVVSGHPLLVPAALEAVKQWVYAPTLLNGQAVEVVTQIDVNFALSQ